MTPKAGIYRKAVHLSVVSILLVSLMGGIVGAQADAEDQPLVSTLFFDTDLRDALSELSLQTGVNIIPDQTVQGLVTADLMDVPLEQALRMLLIGGGYSFRKIDGFYFVGLPDPRSMTFGELVETEIHQLRHVDVQTALGALPAFLIPYVKGGATGNVMTITAPPKEIERIRTLLDRLDKPREQIEVSVLITEVSSQAVRDLGNRLFEYEFAAGQTVNSGWSGLIEHAAGGLLTIGTNIYGDLLTSLRLLEQDQEAKIHADPRILVTPGQPAKIFMGDERIMTMAPDADATARIERVSVGVTLEVTASVMTDDEIVLHLAPEFSHLREDARPELVIKQNSVSSTIRIKDGQTAVLAGMTLLDDSTLVGGVPILKDIPLIGALFRREVERQSDRELLMFVTATIQ